MGRCHDLFVYNFTHNEKGNHVNSVSRGFLTEKKKLVPDENGLMIYSAIPTVDN